MRSVDVWSLESLITPGSSTIFLLPLSATQFCCCTLTQLAGHVYGRIVATVCAIFAGLEWHSPVVARPGACCREHLPPRSGPVDVLAISVTRHLPCCAAPRTTLGFIIIASGCKQSLLCSAEDEGSPAIGTLDGLVLKSHRMTSSPWDLVGVSVIQYLISIFRAYKKLVIT